MRKRRPSQRRQSNKSVKSEKQEPAAKSKANLTEIEEAATGAVGFSVYIRYFKSIGYALTVAAILSNAINSGTSIYSSSKY